MEKKYTPIDLINVATGGKAPPNCDLLLQLQVIEAKDGVARGVWEIDSKFMNGIGVVMGGFLASAADSMMAYAISTKLKSRQTFASIDLHTTFLRPAHPGTIEVKAMVEKLGAKVAYLVAELTQKKKKVAHVVSSVLIIEIED